MPDFFCVTASRDANEFGKNESSILFNLSNPYEVITMVRAT